MAIGNVKQLAWLQLETILESYQEKSTSEETPWHCISYKAEDWNQYSQSSVLKKSEILLIY